MSVVSRRHPNDMRGRGAVTVTLAVSRISALALSALMLAPALAPAACSDGGGTPPRMQQGDPSGSGTLGQTVPPLSGTFAGGTGSPSTTGAAMGPASGSGLGPASGSGLGSSSGLMFQGSGSTFSSGSGSSTGTNASGSSVGSSGQSTALMPCLVQELLAVRRQSCHGVVPVQPAPNSLVTVADMKGAN